MNDVRAFVAHSFATDDAPLVDKFLAFFDEIKSMHPSFDWQHAESAEAVSVSAKVLSLLENKNTLIAICTRAEAVVGRSPIVVPVLSSWLAVKRADYSWKASDWVIQEIGLAVGRGLKVILLLEDGVRSPNGLQADLEWISFDRNKPEASFTKTLQMINKLTPGTGSSPAAGSISAADPRTSPAEIFADAAAQRDEDLVTPSATWQRFDYEFAYTVLIRTDAFEKAERISETYLATAIGREPENAASWKAFIEYVRVRYMKGSLSALRSLAEQQPSNAKTQEYLARAYRYFGSTTDAAVAYLRAAGVETNESAKLTLKAAAAVELASAGKNQEADHILAELRRAVAERPEDEMAFLQALKQVFDIRKEPLWALSAMERIMELGPDDTDARYSLAYEFSENGRTDLALVHYLMIPEDQKKDGAWNNIGVAFGALSLPISSVRAFRKSEEFGSALAKSNLAFKLIKAGFLLEAEKLCKDALSTDDPPENAGEALSRLKSAEQEEAKSVDALRERARPIEEFFRAMGRGLCRPSPEKMATAWQGPDATLTSSTSGETFYAEGTYEVPSGGILAAALGSAQRDQYRISYYGKICGQAIVGKVKRGPMNPAKRSSLALLSHDNTEVDLLMVLSEDSRKFEVMESPRSGTPKLYQIEIVQDS